MQEKKIVLPRIIGAFKLNKMQVTLDGKHQTLSIELQHLSSSQFYDVAIRLDDIGRNSPLKGLYNTLQEFKQILLSEFDSLKVSENGNLTYKFQVKKEKYEIVFLAKRREIQADILIKQLSRKFELRIKELQLKMTTQIDNTAEIFMNTHNQTLKDWNKRHLSLEGQISLLKSAIVDNQRQQQNQLDILDLKLKNINQMIVQNEDKIAEIQEAITDLNRMAVSTTNQVQVFQNTFSESLKKNRRQLKTKIRFKLVNPLQYFFTVEKQLDSLAITYNASDNICRGFIRKVPVANSGITTSSIKQTKTKYKDIRFGVATNAILGQTNANLYQNKECLTYYSYNGDVCKDGSNKSVGRKVTEGEIITMQVDTIQWIVKWSVGQQQLAQTNIPQQMRNQTLYIVILMINQNDVVELLDL